MPTLYGRNMSVQEAKLRWPALYHNRELQLGATATIINFGDGDNFGKVNAATGTGMRYNASGLAPTWTWGPAGDVAPSAWDTPFDLTLESNWKGCIPVLTFNGADEEADSPDAAYWSRAAGAFSVGAWVNFTDATSSAIMCKWDNQAGNFREWVFQTDGSDLLNIILYDESESGDPFILTKTDAVMAEGVWTFVVATADGSADATGLNLYVNGTLAASSDTDQAGFIAMEDLSSTVQLGHRRQTTPDTLFDGKMAGGPIGPFFVQTELTAAQVLNMYRLERHALGV